MRKSWFLCAISLLLISSFALSAQKGKNNPAAALTFFGNPADRMQGINRILRDAGEKIMEQKRMLDDVVARVVANERRLGGGALSAADREKIRQENIAGFTEVEAIREKVARIQHEAGEQVYRIEQAAYQSMTADIAQKRVRLAQNPSEYWLELRKLLFSTSEQSALLPEGEVRAFYR